MENVELTEVSVAIGRKVDEALLELFRKEKIKEFKFPAELEENEKGIDFFTVRHRNNWIPLQVVVSKEDQEAHEENCAGIPSIIVYDETELESIQERIMKIIEFFEMGDSLHL